MNATHIRRRLAWSLAITAPAAAFFIWLVTIPYYIGYTLSSNRGAGAIGGSGVAITWDVPEHFGFDSEPGWHFAKRPDASWRELYTGQRLVWWEWNSLYNVAAMPLWPLQLLSLSPVSVLCWRRLRRRPYACTDCGYDLRGSRGERCPECGQSETVHVNRG